MESPHTFTEAELAEARTRVRAQCETQGITVALAAERLGPLAAWLAGCEDTEAAA